MFSCSSVLLSILAERILLAKFSLEPTVLNPGLAITTPELGPGPELDPATPKLPLIAAELGKEADDTDDADEEDDEAPWLGPEWCDPGAPSPLTLEAGEKPSFSLVVMLPR